MGFIERFLGKTDEMTNFKVHKKSYLSLDSDNLLTSAEKTKKERIDMAKQHQLDLLYSKYNLGLISEKELIDAKERLINDKNVNN